MKILYYGESPCIVTGLSQVSRYILDRLHKDGHSIEVVAMNHFIDDYDHQKYPYVIHPCHNNEGRNTNIMKDRLLNGEYDMFIYSADLGGGDEIFEAMLKAQETKKFISVAYCPVDCDIIPPSTFNYLAIVNVPIVYTQHGKQVVERYRPDLAGTINVIPLGCNPEKFYPLSDEERKKARHDLFNIDDDTFIVLNINRNQHRKDLGRTIMIFHEFHKTHNNSVLYLHSKQIDIGGCLPAIAQSIGMKLDNPGTEIIFTHPDFHEIVGFNAETINRIYNAADCLVSTSTGEGWGLSTTEAMCAGTPVIVPGNTANLEIVGENEERGYLIRSGGDIDHLIVPYGMSSNPREIVHSASMLEKLDHVYNHKLEAKGKAIVARQWALEHTWDQIAQQWSDFVCQAQPLLQELQDKTAVI